MVYFVIYVSSATELFSTAELVDILRTSRENNVVLDVSGMLLYKGGNLMQVLEGEKDAVLTLYDKISRDPRHHGVITMLDGFEETRQFPSWTMAFRDLDEPVVAATAGYSHYLNTSLSSPEFSTDPTLCQQLLSVFKETV